MSFALERFMNCSRPPGRRRPFGGCAVTAGVCSFGALPSSLSCHSSFWRRQVDSSSPCLGKPNGNCLLGRASTMFAFPDVMYFFADEFACLGLWRLTLALIPLRCPCCPCFRHRISP